MAGGGRLGSHESQDRGKKVLRCEGKTERNPVAVSTWSTFQRVSPYLHRQRIIRNRYGLFVAAYTILNVSKHVACAFFIDKRFCIWGLSNIISFPTITYCEVFRVVYSIPNHRT